MKMLRFSTIEFHIVSVTVDTYRPTPTHISCIVLTPLDGELKFSLLGAPFQGRQSDNPKTQSSVYRMDA